MSNPNVNVVNDGRFNNVKAVSLDVETLATALNGTLVISSNGPTGGIDMDAGTGGIDVDTTGQLNLASSQAAATAIVLNASDAAGGIDVNAGTGGIDVDSTGSVNIGSSQSAATAIVLNASGATGGVDVNAGTGGVDVDATGELNLASSQAAATAVSISASDGQGGITLAAGSSGILFPKSTVTQVTSITTGVTINDVSGVITTVAATTANNAADTFTVTNDRVLATSVVLAVVVGYSGTIATNGFPAVIVQNIGAGSFDMTLYNPHGTAALSGTVDIAFHVL